MDFDYLILCKIIQAVEHSLHKVVFIYLGLTNWLLDIVHKIENNWQLFSCFTNDWAWPEFVIFMKEEVWIKFVKCLYKDGQDNENLIYNTWNMLT